MEGKQKRGGSYPGLGVTSPQQAQLVAVCGRASLHSPPAVGVPEVVGTGQTCSGQAAGTPGVGVPPHLPDLPQDVGRSGDRGVHAERKE